MDLLQYATFRPFRLFEVVKVSQRAIRRDHPYKRDVLNESLHRRRGHKGWPESLNRRWGFRAKKSGEVEKNDEVKKIQPISVPVTFSQPPSLPYQDVRPCQYVRRETASDTGISLDGFTTSPTTAYFREAPSLKTVVKEVEFMRECYESEYNDGSATSPSTVFSRAGSGPRSGRVVYNPHYSSQLYGPEYEARVQETNTYRRWLEKLPLLPPIMPNKYHEELYRKRLDLACELDSEIKAKPILSEHVSLNPPARKRPQPYHKHTTPRSPLSYHSLGFIGGCGYGQGRRAMVLDTHKPLPRNFHRVVDRKSNCVETLWKNRLRKAQDPEIAQIKERARQAQIARQMEQARQEERARQEARARREERARQAESARRDERALEKKTKNTMAVEVEDFLMALEDSNKLAVEVAVEVEDFLMALEDTNAKGHVNTEKNTQISNDFDSGDIHIKREAQLDNGIEPERKRRRPNITPSVPKNNKGVKGHVDDKRTSSNTPQSTQHQDKPASSKSIIIGGTDSQIVNPHNALSGGSGSRTNKRKSDDYRGFDYGLNSNGSLTMNRQESNVRGSSYHGDEEEENIQSESRLLNTSFSGISSFDLYKIDRQLRYGSM